MQQRWEELKKNTEKLSKKYEKLNTILERKQFAKTKREQNPTSEEWLVIAPAPLDTDVGKKL